MAGLKKVWIRYDIPDSAGRSQQGLHLYSPNVSLLLLQPLSTTASGFTTRCTAVERCCTPATRLGLETSRWKTLPIRTDPPEAHALEIFRCNCKSDCGFQRCSCKNMEYIALLHVVQVEEIVAQNSPSPDLGENDE